MCLILACWNYPAKGLFEPRLTSNDYVGKTTRMFGSHAGRRYRRSDLSKFVVKLRRRNLATPVLRTINGEQLVRTQATQF